MPNRALRARQATRLINHGPTVLVTSRHAGHSNIITLAWITPLSIAPPMVGIAVAPTRYSHELIAGAGQFVVNVPSPRLLEAVWYCGTVSGRDEDKFAGSGLSAEPARRVDAPAISDCFAHVECRVVDAPVVGDHTLFVGEVAAADVDADAFDKHLSLRGQYHTLHHLGGPLFVTSAGTRLSAA